MLEFGCTAKTKKDGVFSADPFPGWVGTDEAFGIGGSLKEILEV